MKPYSAGPRPLHRPRMPVTTPCATPVGKRKKLTGKRTISQKTKEGFLPIIWAVIPNTVSSFNKVFQSTLQKQFHYESSLGFHFAHQVYVNSIKLANVKGTTEIQQDSTKQLANFQTLLIGTCMRRYKHTDGRIRYATDGGHCTGYPDDPTHDRIIQKIKHKNTQ